MRPSHQTFPSYFNAYIKLVTEDNITDALTVHGNYARGFLNNIREDQSFYKYAENKWTVKEILQHIIDAERIFCYRALCIARKEICILPGFNENHYAAQAQANRRLWNDMVTEYLEVRKSSQHLFHSFGPAELSQKGSIADYEMSVLALGFTIAGHGTHHLNIIRERYLDV